MKREVISIVLLVVAALCLPATILWNGMSDAAEREWRNRPYEGTLDQFWQAYAGLLDEAAEILWRRQDYFIGLLGEWDEEWQLYREDYAGECREPFAPEEWAVLQRIFGERMCSMAVISWWRTPHIEFVVPTSSEGRGRLFHIPAGCDDAGFAELLASLKHIGWADVKKTAYPNWYAAIWRERTAE